MPYLAQGGHSTWSYMVAVSRMHVCAIFDLLLEVIFFLTCRALCVKDSSAEGTCFILNNIIKDNPSQHEILASRLSLPIKDNISPGHC